MKHKILFIIIFIISATFFIVIYKTPFTKNQIAFPYFDNLENQISLSENESNWLKNHPVIRIVPAPEFVPVEFMDEDKRFSGISADFIAYIFNSLSLKLEVIPQKSWENALNAIKNGEADILGAAMETRERTDYALFTSPYIKLQAMILTRRSFLEKELTLEGLAGKTVVAVRGLSWTNKMRKDYPEIKILEVQNVESALKEVAFGGGDAFVSDLATSSFYAVKMGINNLKISGTTPYSALLCIGIRKDWKIFQGILNKCLSAMSVETKKKIFSRWVELENTFLVSEKDYKRVLSAILFVVIFCVIIFGYNLFLKKQINKTTSQLLESEKKYQFLAENISDVIWILGPEGKMIYVSPSVVKIRDYSVEEVLAQNINEILVSPYDEQVEQALNFYKTNKPEELSSGPHLVQQPCRDGRIVWTESYNRVLYDDNDTFVGILGVSRDVTYRKLMEEKIIESEKLKSLGTLAGGIAHDFNNSLTAILGGLDLLEMEEEDPENLDIIKSLHLACEQSSLLVENLLTFARKSSNKMAPLNLNEMIEQIVPLLKRSFLKNIEINLQLDEDLPLISGDFTQINQVLMNLLINAGDAVSENVIITIETTLFKGLLNLAQRKNNTQWVCLVIRDNGQGIAEEELANIFDPFYTTKNTPEKTGTGLGLSTVYGIIQNHNGHIEVQSLMGKGSVFQVFIPLLET